jgi:hypothetical protein
MQLVRSYKSIPEIHGCKQRQDRGSEASRHRPTSTFPFHVLNTKLACLLEMCEAQARDNRMHLLSLLEGIGFQNLIHGMQDVARVALLE